MKVCKVGGAAVEGTTVEGTSVFTVDMKGADMTADFTWGPGSGGRRGGGLHGSQGDERWGRGKRGDGMNRRNGSGIRGWKRGSR